MSLTVGARLGPYEIVGPLGAGGMGEVYRARDSKLHRDVAIKVLPDDVAADPDRLARFEREAQALAALNHPNIAAVYAVEDRAIVMELVEGEDLSARIRRGPIPPNEALPLARQIADALAAAHEAGIIHRDLKPANIKVRDDGTVKVLDFGLAKALAPDAASAAADAMNSPTMSAHATQRGVILGTAAYMSPEQARGKTVDKRADIWAFGVVLYEMLVGKRLFAADEVSDTLAHVLTKEPDWTALPAATPALVRRLLTRCLTKDVKQRLHDIADARLEIDEATAPHADSMSGVRTQAPSGGATLRWRFIALAVGVFLVGGLVVGGFTAWRLKPRAAGPVKVSIGIPPVIHATRAQITSDGRTLIVLGKPRRPDGTDEPQGLIYTRRLDDYEFTPVPGTEGATSYSQSPDGQWLAFLAAVSPQSPERRLSKVRVDGGAPPFKIAAWDADWDPNFVWLEDGDLLILCENRTKFFRLPSDGGPAKPAVKIGTSRLMIDSGFSGQRLPGDRGVFVAQASFGPRGYQVDQWLLDPTTGAAQRLIENAGNARYLSTGHVVFARSDVLMVAPFDLQRLTVTGEPIALSGGLRTQRSFLHGDFDLSSDGTLVFPAGGIQGLDRRLVNVDAAGNATALGSERRAFENYLAVSPDDRQVAAVATNQRGNWEIWIADLDQPNLRRAVAVANADCGHLVWSPNGHLFAYMRQAMDKDDGLYVQRADGEGAPRAILKMETSEGVPYATSWAADGLLVTKMVASDGDRRDILFLPVSGAGEPGPPRALRATRDVDEADARISPDGRLIAFKSDESGKGEIWVASFAAGSLGPARMVSKGGGSCAAFAADGRLFYDNEQGEVMVVRLSATPALSATAPAVAYNLRALRINLCEWHIMADGRLVAIQKGQGEGNITAFNVVFNWFEELKVKAPSGR